MTQPDQSGNCDGKDQLSREQADKVARRMRQRGRANAYRCVDCGFWHVGKPNRTRPAKGGMR